MLKKVLVSLSFPADPLNICMRTAGGSISLVRRIKQPSITGALPPAAPHCHQHSQSQAAIVSRDQRGPITGEDCGHVTSGGVLSTIMRITRCVRAAAALHAAAWDYVWNCENFNTAGPSNYPRHASRTHGALRCRKCVYFDIIGSIH